MEEQNNQTPTMNSPLIPLVAAIAGLLLGLGGIIYGMKAKSSVAKLETSIQELVQQEEGAPGIKETITLLDKKLKSIEGAHNALANQVSQLDGGMVNIVEQMQAAFNKVTERMNELSAGRTSKPRTRASAGQSGSASHASSSASQSYEAGGEYIIQSGDTLSKVAQQMGLSLGALLEANPDVDPRRLRIGQVIQLP